MAIFLAMPKLGLNMTHGIIVSWLVKEGEEIIAGTPILEVETDKATQEIEAPSSGILAKIIKSVGEEVPCNYVIAVITSKGEPIPFDVPAEIAEGVAPTSELQTRNDGIDDHISNLNDQDTQDQKRIDISPSARSLAKELGVDINKITPRSNRIMREDIEAAHKTMHSIPIHSEVPSVSVKPMTTMRRKIAEHMNNSARTVARVGLTIDLDAGNLVIFRNKSQVNGSKISYNIILAKLIAVALKDYPYMNAQIKDEEIWEFETVNMGIAVDTDRGLLVPVLRDVGKKTIETLQNEFDAMSERAVQGKSLVDDLESGTFTISNLGSFDIDSFLPIINVPECSILAVGTIIDKPVVINNQVQIRPRMNMTLAFDHRLVDGAPAARFLQQLKKLIEEVKD